MLLTDIRQMFIFGQGKRGALRKKVTLTLADESMQIFRINLRLSG